MVSNTLKFCRICKQKKSVKEFYKHPETKDLLRSECILCWKQLCEKHRAENIEKALLNAKKYHFFKNYGITLEELEERKKVQNYKCAICSEETKLVVDHCHKTNSIRRLLCNPCNQGLGSFKDNPTLLRNAADCLETKEENEYSN